MKKSKTSKKALNAWMDALTVFARALAEEQVKPVKTFIENKLKQATNPWWHNKPSKKQVKAGRKDLVRVMLDLKKGSRVVGRSFDDWTRERGYGFMERGVKMMPAPAQPPSYYKEKISKTVGAHRKSGNT